ncbi:putative damage-inducible protein DinB [Bacillus mesophilus]|uniref:DinB family protein n=1 Tax=Bacillus mesophilus TaxID=1808955 RepID=A0A6M0QD44_9BACI|nr:putative damage-inducible protein DinB [Bacillus mesophilus]NEY73679.1 DinB family protein [Bacillus mesophilus]
MKQFKITRGQVVKFVKELNRDFFDVQPEGFNNTIHWHVGHVLLSAENFMFGFPKKSTNLPLYYTELFGMGTKPSDWQGEIPTLEELIQQLEDQSSRIQDLPMSFYEEKLPFNFPVGDIKTFGELFGFMLYHEAEHLGQMKAMKRIIGYKSKV